MTLLAIAGVPLLVRQCDTTLGECVVASRGEMGEQLEAESAGCSDTVAENNKTVSA